ncbi:hypothetical protein BKA70DRAFT_1474061 [Coprinopsis sp. MPI-PUGE-AT-0042]|nr:hypothetical protein BKA70DRAFT_1474061 [Coprinopsis sp. MPI-PUGE-AT-0042]
MIAILQGKVDGAAPFPLVDSSYYWLFECLLSASLVPMTVADFATSGSSYSILNSVFGLSLIMHSHFGVRSDVIPFAT